MLQTQPGHQSLKLTSTTLILTCIFKRSSKNSLLVETEYSSEYFKKELERCPQPDKYALKTTKYEIDPATHKVTMRFHKKYKYESLNPFNISQKVHKTDWGYVLQISFESCVLYPIFMETAKFIPTKDFDVVPLETEKNDENIFDNSQTLKTGDKRSYIIKLKKKSEVTLEDLLLYYKQGYTDLGRMQIFWISGLGEKSLFWTKPMVYQYPTGNMQVFAVKLLNAPKELVVEEPVTFAMKITNMSPNAYQLRIYVKEEEAKTISINSLSIKVFTLRLTQNRKWEGHCRFRALSFKCWHIQSIEEYNGLQESM